MPGHSIRARPPSTVRDADDDDNATIVAPVGGERASTDVSGFLEDAAHFAGGHADAVIHPRTEAEIARVLVEHARIWPIGAQSSVTGGATPDGGVILATSRLNAIQESGQERVRVGAGVPLERLQDLLSDRGLWYAPVPTFTGAFAGGVVATNAAGATTFKYGTTRAWVDALTVVLACGCVLDVERGAVTADDSRAFEIVCTHGTRTVRHGAYQVPAVSKCSAGYFAAPGMDLIDLFIGAEGTLGIIASVTFRIAPRPPAQALALVHVGSERGALALVEALRRAAQDTWRSRDPRGIDVAAIESLDARCLELLREDGADRQQSVAVRADANTLLLIQLELPPGTTAARAADEIADARVPHAPDTPVVRFCRLLDRHGAFDDAEIAMPGDVRRASQFLALREAAPAAVNRRIGEAKRTIDPRLEKTAADMIVPVDTGGPTGSLGCMGEMLQRYRDGCARRGLDLAIWGHVSDGNVHPNVIPRSYEDMVAGREAILEFGRDVARLGGCPLAEHGVGRSPLKQRLLREFYGDGAMAEMQAVKMSLDPDGKLAPGVIVPANPKV